MREKTKIRIGHLLLWLLGALFFLWNGHFLPPVSCVAGEEAPKWSIQFNETPISEVLERLEEATGIDIFANKFPEGRVLNKSYVDRTVEQILRDAFKDVNYALITHEGERGVDAITIWVLDQKGTVGSSPISITPDWPRRVSSPIQRRANNPIRNPGGKAPTDQTDEEELESEGIEFQDDEEPQIEEPLDEDERTDLEENEPSLKTPADSDLSRESANNEPE